MLRCCCDAAAVADWVQNVVAPDQGQNPARIRDIFAARRKAEAMLAPALPIATFRDEARGIIAKLVTIARGAVHTRTVTLPAAGETLTVWSGVENKRVAVDVKVEPAGAAAVTFRLSGEQHCCVLLCN